MKRYVVNLLIALDQFGNALLGGDPDMTISTRLGAWLRSHNPFKRKTAQIVCSVLDVVDKNHCQDAKE